MRRTDGKGKEQTVFTASELQEGVKNILDRVQFKGETLFVTRWNQPAAKLVPLTPADLARLEGAA